MQDWLNRERDWIVYVMSKGHYRYVGITSKTLKDRLKRHKKFVENPANYTLLANAMRQVGDDGWRMKRLARLRGTYYDAREVERTYMYLSNLNESLNPY